MNHEDEDLYESWQADTVVVHQTSGTARIFSVLEDNEKYYVSINPHGVLFIGTKDTSIVYPPHGYSSVKITDPDDWEG